jgi:hypothetical protein
MVHAYVCIHADDLPAFLSQWDVENYFLRVTRVLGIRYWWAEQRLQCMYLHISWASGLVCTNTRCGPSPHSRCSLQSAGWGWSGAGPPASRTQASSGNGQTAPS